jgi:hypothetical protein
LVFLAFHISLGQSSKKRSKEAEMLEYSIYEKYISVSAKNGERSAHKVVTAVGAPGMFLQCFRVYEGTLE